MKCFVVKDFLYQIRKKFVFIYTLNQFSESMHILSVNHKKFTIFKDIIIRRNWVTVVSALEDNGGRRLRKLQCVAGYIQ